MEKTSGLAPGQGPRNTSFKLGSNVCFCPPTDPNGLFKPKFTCNILALIFFFHFPLKSLSITLHCNSSLQI
ncbi:hypothetical protein IC582_011035 [Cucumis melo]